MHTQLYLTPMAWTIAAVDPVSGSRELLVEVHPDAGEVTEAMLLPFTERLFRRNIRVGLVVTLAQTLVVKDTLSSMTFSGNRFALTRLDTAALVAQAGLGAPRPGEQFRGQVVAWLEAIGTSWYSFLHETAVSAMVPDVVGNLTGASLETWDDLLSASNAAE